jgi:hypothetical protein
LIFVFGFCRLAAVVVVDGMGLDGFKSCYVSLCMCICMKRGGVRWRG